MAPPKYKLICWVPVCCDHIGIVLKFDLRCFKLDCKYTQPEFNAFQDVKFCNWPCSLFCLQVAGGTVIVCNVCAKPCKTRRYLEDHMRGMHKLGRPFVCACGAINWWRANFLTHKKSCQKANSAAGRDKMYPQWYFTLILWMRWQTICNFNTSIEHRCKALIAIRWQEWQNSWNNSNVWKLLLLKGIS